MGLFDKFKAGLQKTHSKLTHEIKRIVTRSPKLEAETLDELEAALIAADLGLETTAQIIQAVKKSYETQGTAGLDIFAIAGQLVESNFSAARLELLRAERGPTVVSVVGVNGTGKTTTAAKLAHLVQARGQSVLRYIPSRRYRATQALGPAPEHRGRGRRLRGRCRRRGSRRRGRRPGSQYRLSFR
jgi:fused signal recognition particle receptor